MVDHAAPAAHSTEMSDLSKSTESRVDNIALEKQAAIYDGDEALRIIVEDQEPVNAEEERKVLRKIDFRVCSLMFFLQGLQFVDKNTLSYAGTYGIIKQANLKGQEFSAILAATASATNFHTLAAGRFFLGFFESCVNPGLILITSSWYKREEQAFRIGLWVCANGVVGAPSGLLFWAIARIDVDGIFPYQWMFMFFGIFTVLFGISLWWILPDSPMTARFLTQRERRVAIERLKDNGTGTKNTHHKKDQVREALTDVKVWILVACVFFHNITNSLQNTFTGIIIKGFGYSTYEAVLLNLPQYGILVVCLLIVGWFTTTKYGEGKRIFLILLFYIPGIVSSVILYRSPVNHKTLGLHLYAVFTLLTVTVSTVLTYSLLAGNVAGYTKKTVTGTLFFMSYCVANIISPQVFLDKERPTYPTGIAVTLACFCLNIVLFSVLYVLYTLENKKRDAEQLALGEDYVERTVADSFADLTDKQNKSFRYKL